MFFLHDLNLNYTQCFSTIATNMGVAIVVAATKTWGIGNKGRLPWHLKGDMLYFKKLTMSCNNPNATNAVVMGRKTWESIPARYCPLPGRMNIVVTRTPETLQKVVPDTVSVTSSINNAISLASSATNVEKIFIIGGASMYKQAMALPQCTEIFLTAINHDFDCDTHMPPINTTIFKQDPDYGNVILLY